MSGSLIILDTQNENLFRSPQLSSFLLLYCSVLHLKIKMIDSFQEQNNINRSLDLYQVGMSVK